MLMMLVIAFAAMYVLKAMVISQNWREESEKQTAFCWANHERANLPEEAEKVAERQARGHFIPQYSVR